MVYGGVQRARISNNSIVAKPDSAARAFIVTQSQGTRVPTDVTIDGNTASSDGGAVQDGFASFGGTERLTVTDNNLSGFSAVGIGVNDSRDFLVARNRVVGNNAEVGVSIARSSPQGTVDGNLAAGVREPMTAPEDLTGAAGQPAD